MGCLSFEASGSWMQASQQSRCSWWRLSFLPPCNLDTLNFQCPYWEDASQNPKDVLCLHNNMVPHHAAPPPQAWLCVVTSCHIAVVPVVPMSLLFALRPALAFAAPASKWALTPTVLPLGLSTEFHFTASRKPFLAKSPQRSYAPVVLLGSS